MNSEWSEDANIKKRKREKSVKANFQKLISILKRRMKTSGIITDI